MSFALIGKAIWAFLKGVPLWVYAAILAVLLILGYGHMRYNAGQAAVQKEFDAYKAKLIAATAAAKLAAERAEAAQAGAIKSAVDQFKRENENAKVTATTVATDVRSGAVKLRDHWKGCPARLPETPSGPEGGDAAAELRATGAGRIVGTGAEADAQVRALQAIIASAPHCFTVDR